MTPSACSTCGRSVAVGMTHTQRIGSRWVQWRLCVACDLEERARHASEAAELTQRTPPPAPPPAPPSRQPDLAPPTPDISPF